MKVLDKMNELVKASATKEEIINWAYINRVMVMGMYYEEKEFEVLEKTVEKFIESEDYHGIADEHEAWSKFLDYEYIK